MNRFGDRRLYLCTPIQKDLAAFVESCVKGGVDIVQLREKNAPDREIVAAARQLSRLLRPMGIPFIINDRPDIAILSGADGVHVGQDDLSPGEVRSILGSGAIVGTSNHSATEHLRSIREPCDYLSIGPVAETPTKPGRPGTGVDLVREAASVRDGRPRYVTGGVTPQTIPEIARAGGTHFVVVRYLTTSNDPRGAATKLRRAIEAALGR